MNSQQIFISYSHHDSKMKDLLISFFISANMPKTFTAWSDKDIQIGEEWEKKIFDAIDNANAAVLLISHHFLSSSYIMNIEIPRMLDRWSKKELDLFPLIIDHCPWDEHEWLEKLQIFPGGDNVLAHMKDQNKYVNEFTLKIKHQLFPNLPDQNTTQQNVQSSQKMTLTKDLIFYDIDRKKWIDYIIHQLRDYHKNNYTHNLTWIFHGHENQCLNKFRQILIDQTIKPCLNDCAKVIDNIDWPDLDSPLAIQDKITTEIAKKIDAPLSQWDYDDVVKKLNAHHGSVIIPCTIYSSQWENYCQDTLHDHIQNFIALFHTWPTRVHGPLIALLMINYCDIPQPQKRFGWFRKKQPCDFNYNHMIRHTLETIHNADCHHPHLCVFDELSSIPYHDVKQWADQECVKCLAEEDNIMRAIKKIYDPHYHKVPMIELATTLKKQITQQ